MNIGLFFGTFNPIHIGHLAIANYIVEFTDIDELWFVVSPQNPLKQKSSLLDDYHRLELVNIAIANDIRFIASDIEFYMPKPSFTIDALTYLKEKHPKQKFTLIMGADNFASIHKWKNYKQILNNYNICVYPRTDIDIKQSKEKNISIVNAPLMEISSSFIRNAIKNGKEINYYLNNDVYKYIIDMHFYEK